MYSVTEALASMISGGRSVLGGVGEGGFEEGEGCDVEEGIEVVEVEEQEEEDDDAGDAGSCGYKDAGSSTAIFWKSSSREVHVLDTASILASSIDSGGSSNGSTV